MFLTRWFGVTENDAERNFLAEKSDIEEIVEKSLLMQANAAAQQHRPKNGFSQHKTNPVLSIH